MKHFLPLLLLVACNHQVKHQVKKVPIKKDSTFNTMIGSEVYRMDSIEKAKPYLARFQIMCNPVGLYAVKIGEKYIGRGELRAWTDTQMFYAADKLVDIGYEIQYEKRQAAEESGILFLKVFDEKRKQDSIAKLQHIYKPCK